jgi:hypothetical protein
MERGRLNSESGSLSEKPKMGTRHVESEIVGMTGHIKEEDSTPFFVKQKSMTSQEHQISSNVRSSAAEAEVIKGSRQVEHTPNDEEEAAFLNASNRITFRL